MSRDCLSAWLAGCLSVCLSARAVIPGISAALNPEEHFVSPLPASVWVNLTSCDPDTERRTDGERGSRAEGERQRWGRTEESDGRVWRRTDGQELMDTNSPRLSQ